MSKKIKGMMGFTHSDITWEPMDVLAEIPTGGEDSDGYVENEAIGIAINQYGEKCLYRGSLDSTMMDGSPTIILNKDGKPISVLLRELADKLDKEGE